MSDQSTRYSVIGDPIAHSLSPDIHRYIREKSGFTYQYDKIQIKPGELAQFIRQCRQTGKPGFNVTLPHKETVIPLLDELHPSAEKVGAVNTVSNRKGILTGYNTDISGCRMALELAGLKQMQNGIILGAGGAARAGVAALIEMGCPEITLIARNQERARRTAADFSHPPVQVHSLHETDNTVPGLLQKADVLINATPVGMWPQIDATPLAATSLTNATTVLDMVPNPPRTRLLREAAATGCQTVSGLDMLICQALAAQEIWQNRSLPQNLFADLKKHLLEKIQKNSQ